MAFCGKCGQKNPEGAKFCSACGSPLHVVGDTVWEEAPRTAAPQRERVTLHKESTPPPRMASEPQDGRSSAWQKSMNRMSDASHRQEQRAPQRNDYRQERQEQPPRRNRGVEKPVKKGGSFGGCLKKLLLWIIGLVVVAGLALWGIGSCLYVAIQIIGSYFSIY